MKLRIILPAVFLTIAALWSGVVSAASTENKYSKPASPTPTPAEPKTARDFFEAAIGSFQAGDSNNAEKYSKVAISMEPSNPDFHNLLGKVYLYRGAEKNRLEIRSTGIDSPETNYVKRYVRGRDELILARNEFKIVTNILPDFAEAWLNLGVCEDNLGDNEQAGIDAYKQAVRMAPNSTIARDAYNNLGLVLNASGKPEEALEAYRSALKIDPTFSPSRLNMERLLTANPKLRKKLDNQK